MKAQEWELQSGLKFTTPVPESVEEFDRLPGGRVGLCLECGIDDVMYRGPFAQVRDLLAEAIEKANPDTPRLRKPHPNTERAKKGDTVVSESPNRYIGRVAAVLGLNDEDGSLVREFQPILDEIMANNATLIARREAKDPTLTDDEKASIIEFSVEKVARTGTGAGLVGKGDLEQAAQLIAKGPEALATSLSKLQGALGLAEPIVLPDDAAQKQIALAKQLKALRAMLMKQAMASLA